MGKLTKIFQTKTDPLVRAGRAMSLISREAAIEEIRWAFYEGREVNLSVYPEGYDAKYNGITWDLISPVIREHYDSLEEAIAAVEVAPAVADFEVEPCCNDSDLEE
jgi:hypothetical protein